MEVTNNGFYYVCVSLEVAKPLCFWIDEFLFTPFAETCTELNRDRNHQLLEKIAHAQGLQLLQVMRPGEDIC